MYIDLVWIIIGALALGFAGTVFGYRLGVDAYSKVIQQQIRAGKLKEIARSDEADLT